nr:uncharacterized protein LOC107966375 isoform X2 [Pan troglodytes]XP_016800452.1 uncharacterized protein LOC107966375 isoform X2 [Pan troglodytes]
MGRSGLTPHPAGQSHRLSRRGPSAHWGWQRRHPVRRGCSQNCHCVSTVAGCVSTAAVLELPARLLTKMGGSLCCCGEGEGFFYRQNWQFPSLDSRDLIQAAHSTHSAIQLYSMHSGISHLLRKDLSFEKGDTFLPTFAGELPWFELPAGNEAEVQAEEKDRDGVEMNFPSSWSPKWKRQM